MKEESVCLVLGIQKLTDPYKSPTVTAVTLGEVSKPFDLQNG